MRAAGGQTPVVLRAERSGRGGDCQWQRDAFCGGRIATQCRRAAAVIAPSPEIEQELLAAGYSPSLVRVIPNGVPDAPPRTPQTRRRPARCWPRRIRSCNCPTPRRWPCIWAGWNRIAVWSGFWRLGRLILRRWPNARLWLIGEGSLRRALRRQIETRILAGHVLVVGTFDEVDAVLATADVFLRPTSEPDSGVALCEAFAAGLPVVASDIAGHRE